MYLCFFSDGRQDDFDDKYTIPHGSYWRTTLCLISLLQWAVGCWAQREALCVPPQIALKCACGDLQKRPFRVLDKYFTLDFYGTALFFKDPDHFASTASSLEWLSDGASVPIWAKTYCSKLCCSLHIEQGSPPSSTQCSLGSLRGQAAGGEMERASCFCWTQDLSVWHRWRCQDSVVQHHCQKQMLKWA